MRSSLRQQILNTLSMSKSRTVATHDTSYAGHYTSQEWMSMNLMLSSIIDIWAPSRSSVLLFTKTRSLCIDYLLMDYVRFLPLISASSCFVCVWLVNSFVRLTLRGMCCKCCCEQGSLGCFFTRLKPCCFSCHWDGYIIWQGVRIYCLSWWQS